MVKDGNVVLHAREYGLADIAGNVPIIPETAFLLASLTKQFAAMLIMILVKQGGGFSYKSTLFDFFPQFPDYAKAITVERLLRHTSGLPEFDTLFQEAGMIDRDWPRSLRSPVSEFEPTSADTLDLLSRQTDLLFKPGDKCLYNNSGYVVLGQIIEKVASTRSPEFMKKTIFDPAGMALLSSPSGNGGTSPSGPPAMTTGRTGSTRTSITRR